MSNILKELRKSRKRRYQETKNMSLEERAEYYHVKSEELQQEIAEYKKKHGIKK
ncbi:MAG: hypothetical protein LBE12_07720 [Planctomycetaceae bacterium]|jgi:L-lactate utilization protein LutC|nr:hypothetical protein [Planctomycetaceae bacterium]